MTEVLLVSADTIEWGKAHPDPAIRAWVEQKIAAREIVEKGSVAHESNSNKN